MKKFLKYYLLIVFLLFIVPVFVFAQNEKQDNVFQAKVLEVVKEQQTKLSDGFVSSQQNLKLIGLDGEYEGKEFAFTGIGNYDVIKKNNYKKNDQVLVVASADDQGVVTFYVTDYVRSSSLAWVFVIFVLVLLLVGGTKGFRAVLSLIISFLIIVKYIIPQILDGVDPVIVTIIGSFAILLVVVYLTEGFNKNSHIASLSIFVSLLFTMFLSSFFVAFARLSGLGSENVSFLVSLDSVDINFKGLLLAGIIIGTLGVLDDVVIAQVISVEQIYLTDKLQSKKEVFHKAYKVGVSHISSMANTLFLAYAGASFPLLILFVSGESAFSGFFDVMNNEAIATEIIRTLAGSIGLILAVPISTFLATAFLKEK